MVEVLTGHLPAAGGEPTALGAPRFVFTSNTAWAGVRRVLARHAASFLRSGERLFQALGDSLASAHPSSGQRLEAVLAHLSDRCRRIPLPLTASSYYPRNVRVCHTLGVADRLEFALLVGALAGAAKLTVEVFLARDGLADFDPGVPTPAQFDRVVLRVLLAEEDRTILIDPWTGSVAAGTLPACDLLLPCFEAEWDFLRLEPGDDRLVPLEL
jgi:hypothetical protein